VHEGGIKLAQLVLEEYFEARIKHQFEVWFPGPAWTQYGRLKVLRDIEIASIQMIAAKLKDDVASLQPYYWESPAEKAAMLDLAERAGREFRDWESTSRSEAESHSNWTDRGSHFEGRCGYACSQAIRISRSGWGGT
jgi:hypothetical protein